MPESQITILANDQISKVKTLKNNRDTLWIKAAELKAATGFELKKSGVCYDPLNLYSFIRRWICSRARRRSMAEYV